MEILQALSVDDWQHLFQIGFFIALVITLLICGAGIGLIKSYNKNEASRLALAGQQVQLEQERLKQETLGKEATYGILNRLTKQQEEFATQQAENVKSIQGLTTEHHEFGSALQEELRLTRQVIEQSKEAENKQTDVLSLLNTDLRAAIETTPQTIAEAVITGLKEQLSELSNVSKVLEERQKKWQEEGEAISQIKNTLEHLNSSVVDVLEYTKKAVSVTIDVSSKTEVQSEPAKPEETT